MHTFLFNIFQCKMEAIGVSLKRKHQAIHLLIVRKVLVLSIDDSWSPHLFFPHTSRSIPSGVCVNNMLRLVILQLFLFPRNVEKPVNSNIQSRWTKPPCRFISPSMYFLFLYFFVTLPCRCLSLHASRSPVFLSYCPNEFLMDLVGRVQTLWDSGIWALITLLLLLCSPPSSFSFSFHSCFLCLTLLLSSLYTTGPPLVLRFCRLCSPARCFRLFHSSK